MSLGKVLIIVGGVLILIGLLVQYFDRLPFIGKLPGDILVERENFRLYLPITTSILLSILITVVLYIIGKIKN